MHKCYYISTDKSTGMATQVPGIITGTWDKTPFKEMATIAYTQ